MLRLRELREARKPPLTQEGLAYLSGVAVKTVQRAEKTGDANSRTLRKFAAALGVEPGELFALPNSKRQRKAS